MGRDAEVQLVWPSVARLPGYRLWIWDGAVSGGVDNVASRRVVQASGGVLVGEFRKPPQYGGHAGLRFRTALA